MPDESNRTVFSTTDSESQQVGNSRCITYYTWCIVTLKNVINTIIIYI